MSDGEAADGASEASEPVSVELGYDSSGGSASEDEFVGCESRSEDEAEGGGGNDGGGGGGCDGGSGGGGADDDDDAADGADGGGGGADEEEAPLCIFCMAEVDLDQSPHAGDEDGLCCDGGCGREMRAAEPRLGCAPNFRCDFDICLPCAGFGRAAAAAAAAAVAPAPPPAAAAAPPSLTLGDEMDENDKIIDDELDGGGDPDIGGLHRTARYFMYRAFVAAQYGHLGKGNRVRSSPPASWRRSGRATGRPGVTVRCATWPRARRTPTSPARDMP